MQAMMSWLKTFTSMPWPWTTSLSGFTRMLSRSSAVGLGVLAILSTSTAVAQDPSSFPSEWESLQRRNTRGPECFRTHLREAIQLNRTRGVLYAQLSQGESQALTDKLISLERLAIFGSYLPFLGYNFDERALEWQNSSARIQIVCDEFISMHETPAYRSQFADGPVRKSLSIGRELEAEILPPLLSPISIQRRLRRALNSSPEKFIAHQHLANEAHQLLQELEGHWPTRDGQYLGGPRPDISELRKSNCMLRHMLESIRRIARLSPRHHMRALDFGLRSPLTLSQDLLTAHIKWLGEAIEIDREAAALHQRGIPIVCNDVPTIPDAR